MDGSQAGARRLAVITAVMFAIVAAQAQAHPIINPGVAKSDTTQQYTLSVPTEKEGKTTARIELVPPAGFSLDSYEAEPGWKRDVVKTGSGDKAVVQKVTWSGGHVPTDEDAVFRFNASAKDARTYMFNVTQTYSDGSVVQWSDPSEKADTPAPRIEAVKSFGGGKTGGSSNTLAAVALIVGGLALVVSIGGLAAGKRPLT